MGADAFQKVCRRSYESRKAFWNSDNVVDELHTVAMRKTSDGKYELFNFNPITEDTEPVDNLNERLREEGVVPLSLYCISK